MNNTLEIKIQDLKNLNKEEYLLVDIREEAAFAHGFIPNAVNIPLSRLREKPELLPKEKKIILYCAKGILSYEAAEELEEKGYDVAHLAGGYGAWLLDSFSTEERYPEIEKSIRKKFHKTIFSRFTKAINEYELVKEGDKIAVCISGGKDSMLMAKLFQELQKHRKVNFDVIFLVMDPGYNETNRKVIEENARLLNIPITIFETNIFETVYEIEKSPCYLCARMRRGYLYSKAKELGCNKIALGHHYDDVIETILMGMLYGAQIQTMMPKLHSTNFEGMELIRPMYLIREDDIKHWRDYNDLHFIQCACRFTDTCTTCREDGSTGSKRMEIKGLIKELKEINPFIEGNIFKSVENVNLSTVIAYKENGIKHHFLENYDTAERTEENG
ncbi:rhodanese-like domain-containing protein [Blautia sp. Marseille-P3201T]|uniref:rhodanese-like domain-containing protein n=1 Tax=Blautia sp. Marseille-P3201T TaxID=1907659 RepID=UPI000931196E|nr:rhodanese-like domain-containing protein [Blautia sp. Marseille-P3201T]